MDHLILLVTILLPLLGALFIGLVLPREDEGAVR